MPVPPANTTDPHAGVTGITQAGRHRFMITGPAAAMRQMYRFSPESLVLCRDCLDEDEAFQAAELDPALFPDTYTALICTRCGRSARDCTDTGHLPSATPG